jgi:hypothetical protein
MIRFPATPLIAPPLNGDSELLLADLGDIGNLESGTAGTSFWMEEWLDGVMVAISLNDDGEPVVQNANQFISAKKMRGNGPFGGLDIWISDNYEILQEILWPNMVLLGQWLAKMRTVFYDNLPDPIMFTEVYDRDRDHYLDIIASSEFLDRAGYHYCDAGIWEDKFDIDSMVAVAKGTSSYQTGLNSQCKGLRVVQYGKTDDKVEKYDKKLGSFYVANPAITHVKGFRDRYNCVDGKSIAEILKG